MEGGSFAALAGFGRALERKRDLPGTAQPEDLCPQVERVTVFGHTRRPFPGWARARSFLSFQISEIAAEAALSFKFHHPRPLFSHTSSVISACEELWDAVGAYLGHPDASASPLTKKGPQ